MKKTENNTPVAEAVTGVNSEAVQTPDVLKTDTDVLNVEAEENVHEAELIPSGTFVAESGDEYEFTTNSFIIRGTVFTKEEALINHPDVLEELISLKSFILKKK